MLNGGVPIAVGFSASIIAPAAAAALRLFMEALQQGRTFAQAAEKAGKPAGAGGAGVEMRFAKDYNDGMTLNGARQAHMAAIRGE
jgi:hypothetical protein